MARFGREDDERLLLALHLVEAEGRKATHAAKEVGLTKGQLAGLRMRVRDESAKAGPCLCKKPENKDGGLKPLWWRKQINGGSVA